MLAAAVMFGLVVVLALVSGPRQSWNGGSVGWVPFAILFGVAIVVIVIIGRVTGPPPPQPPPTEGQRFAGDIWTAGLIFGVLVLIGLKACG
jgi:hypothetical protein